MKSQIRMTNSPIEICLELLVHKHKDHLILYIIRCYLAKNLFKTQVLQTILSYI